MVIRPGDAPAFWLRLQRGAQTRDLGLGVLDAVALLVGDRVEAVVEIDSSHTA